jgi:hypothetical protein
MYVCMYVVLYFQDQGVIFSWFDTLKNLLPTTVFRNAMFNQQNPQRLLKGQIILICSGKVLILAP